MSTSDAFTDVVELCALLQCIGFSVKSLETIDANMSHDGGARTVDITCQTSGLHVVLESPSMSCSCPTPSDQNSGVWQVSGVAGGKQLDKEFGFTLLGSLPKGHRERLTNELREMIRCIKENNETSGPDKIESKKEENKSASMTDLKTPEKLLYNRKVDPDTPTRYRSLDTLTSKSKKDLGQIPTPGTLQRANFTSESDVENIKAKMVHRQSTYTLSSTPGSVRLRNKTSSPIHPLENPLLDILIAARKAAVNLGDQLANAVQVYMEKDRNDSSMSSLALEVSKISELKVAEAPQAQFASSPNLSGVSGYEDFTKGRLKRFESVSSSNLTPKTTLKQEKVSRLRRISPNLFRVKSSPTIKVDKIKTQDPKSKMNCLFKPKVIKPIVRESKSTPVSEPSPTLSTSSRNKYSHIKSTIPRPAKKE